LVHFCHFSESSKWNVANARDLRTSVLQCVPDSNKTEVVFESTAKGVGGEFYGRFWGSRYRCWVKKLDENHEPVVENFVNEQADPENIYTSIFLPWFVYDRYKMTVPDDFKLIRNDVDTDLCEVRLKEQFGLSDSQIVWRRFTLVNKCDNDINTFRQEYPSTPEEAFIGTGRPVFDNVKLMKLRDTLPEPIARYDAVPELSQWVVNSTDGKLRVWEEPKHGQSYVIGADVAEGLKKGDFSCADVVNHRTGVQVAQYHGKIDPDQFGVVLCMLGKRYNTALVAPERNNHGLMTVTTMYNRDYPNLYCEMVPDPPGRPRARYGWVTGGRKEGNRPLMIDTLVKEIRDDCHGIHSKDTIDELIRFKRNDQGRMEADEGSFDDRVISYCITKHVRDTIEVPLPQKPAHYKDRRTIGSSKGISALAWT
jgi:hypothetical protein